MKPTISIALQDSGGEVRLERGPTVDTTTWLQVRSEFGSPNANANRFLVIPLEAFLSRRRVLAGICRDAGATIRFDDGVRDLLVAAQANEQSLHRRLADPVDLDEGDVRGRLRGGRFTRELRPFQLRDLGRLLALDHGANFSVPGAGKTTVTLAAYEAERLAGRVERLLVVAPLSAFDAWLEEAVDCFDQPLRVARAGRDPILPDTELVLVNYQRLDTEYERLAEWVVRRPTMVVLDEAHRMKRGWEGAWGTRCLSLAYLAQRRDILSGTPAPQSPKDFVALLDYLWPGQATTILPGDVLVTRPPADAGERVATAIGPLFARTTKRELDLPEVEFDPIVVPLEPLHADLYAALRAEYAGRFLLDRDDERDLFTMGQVVMYLLEAATNPKLLTAGSLTTADAPEFRHPPLVPEPGSRLATLLERYNEFETPAKFQQLALIVERNAAAGRKTLVWSNFVRNLLTLRRMLARYQPALVHGGVPPYAEDGETSRETELRRFRRDDDCMVLLANPAAMSEGVSLHHDCHHAVYLDRTFNAGQYLQSLDRIHRLGLEPGTITNFTLLISAGTIDETVDDRVRTKAALLGEMLDDDLTGVALPSDEDYGAPIEADPGDIAALFAHLRGEPSGSEAEAVRANHVPAG